MRLDKHVLKTLRRAERPLDVQAVVNEIASEQGLRVTAEQVEHVLRELRRTGLVYPVGEGKYVALREKNIAVGRLAMNRRGFGFVSTPIGDIYVSKHDIDGAMHGDLVEVRIHPRRGRHAGRSGEIIRVIEHRTKKVIGRFEKHGGLGIIIPTDPRIQGEVFVDLSGLRLHARPGDIVVARITRYADRRDVMQGEIVEVLGPQDAPGVDVEIIIREHGLESRFPSKVIKEADELEADVETELGRGRRDLREMFTFTIDPADARDFDDAISIEREGSGYHLWVHIADVSRYVPWDSVVDVEARRRGTSVYLVDRVLPMLPDRLSNVICSLGPGQDRLAFTIEIRLDALGRTESCGFYESVVSSDRRFDYDHVQDWLEHGGFPDELSRRALGDLRSLAARLHHRRIERGGLDLDTVEAKVILDGKGRPIDVVLRSRTEATGMIEEAMILANETVARHMAAANAPMLYRIHEDPDPDALAQMAIVLKEFGYPVQDIRDASPATFQRILSFARGRPEEQLINSLVLRALERARYVDYLAPHFGLASTAYTHFTSPIRRYPDLIVHRLLKAQLTRSLERPPASLIVPELGWLAEHSSTMEREAEAAEEESQRAKLVALMAEHIGEEFDGIITGVVAFGFFVQLENTAEGLVHVESMADDYYRLDSERFLLRGERTGKTYRLGQRVRVRVREAIPVERRLDLELAS